jgi:hypothetical protein
MAARASGVSARLLHGHVPVARAGDERERAPSDKTAAQSAT